MSDDDLKARFIPIYDRVGTFRLEPIENFTLGPGGGFRILSVDDADFTLDDFAGETIVVFPDLSDTRVLTLPPLHGSLQVVTVKIFNTLVLGASLSVRDSEGHEQVPLVHPNATVRLSNQPSESFDSWVLLDNPTEFVAGMNDAVTLTGYQPHVLSFRGNFDPFTSYNPADLVRADDGILYWADVPAAGVQPYDDGRWNIIRDAVPGSFGAVFLVSQVRPDTFTLDDDVTVVGVAAPLGTIMLVQGDPTDVGSVFVKQGPADTAWAELSAGTGLRTIPANDIDVVVDAFNGTTVVLYTTLTERHTVSLPPASGPPQIVTMKDRTGAASGDHPLSFIPDGDDEIADSTDIVRGNDTHHGVSSVINDGISAWSSVLDTSALLSDLIAQLGGTDGAGNIFVPFFDAVDSISGWQCTAPNGDRTTMSVGPTSVRMNAQQHDDGAQAYIDVSLDSGIDIETSDPLIPIRINGASMGGASILREFPFAFDTPDLLTGAALYTPTPGDILLEAWIEIDTAWDGTTPLADLGTFVGNNAGAFGGFTPGPIDMTQADVVAAGYGLKMGFGGPSGVGFANLINVGNAFVAIGDSAPFAIVANPVGTSLNIANRPFPATFASTDPIKVCVSQDGTNTGDDPASTQGSAVLYLVTASPVAA